MKKIILTCAAAALLMASVSCKKEKEGVYNPKEKIQKIYLDYKVYENGELANEMPKYLSESWSWKEDLLDRITYYQPTYSEEVSIPFYVYTQLFTYDNDNRLTKSEVLGYANMYATYEYDGQYLKTIKMYENNQYSMGFTFNRDGKTVTSITVTFTSDMIDKASGNKQLASLLQRTNPLRFVLAPEAADQLLTLSSDCAKKVAKKGSKLDPAMVNIEFELEWKDGNITHYNGRLYFDELDAAMTYDTKHNPYLGLYDLVNTLNESSGLHTASMSKNNITSITLTASEATTNTTESDTYNYTYTYNSKDYPATKTITENYGYRETLVTTTYFEY